MKSVVCLGRGSVHALVLTALLLAAVPTSIATYFAISDETISPQGLWSHLICSFLVYVGLIVSYVAVTRAFRVIQSSVWASHDQCPHCGYDLRSTHGEQCPECGHDVPSLTPLSLPDIEPKPNQPEPIQTNHRETVNVSMAAVAA